MRQMGQAEVDSRLEDMRAYESLADIEARLNTVGIPVIDGRVTCAECTCGCFCDGPCVCARNHRYLS